MTRGTLDLVVCEDCGFVFNRAFESSLMAYGTDYDNTQSHSAFFDAHVRRLVEELVDRRGVRNMVIVEVGCGKGHFLRALVEFTGSNTRGIGFDPSYVGPETDLGGRLSFRKCNFDDRSGDAAADIVVCRHVIEHVHEPMTLLRLVRAALRNSRGGRAFFETPCVDWILRNRVVWDLFYEHCSLFSASSMATAFQRAGFVVDRVDHVFGSQYLWLEARASSVATVSNHSGSVVATLARTFGAEEYQLRQRWHETLGRLKARGNVALWGAGAKGATFANLCDPERSIVDCVVDLNPKKQGHYIPGTGHPIVAPNCLPGRGVKSVVLMNPNYREEIMQLLAKSQIHVELIDVAG